MPPYVEPYKPLNHVRIVTAASLFDGHDAAINIMRRILQATGAEVIHLGNCLVHPCPTVDLYEKTIQDELEIEVVRGTHP